MIAPIKNEKIVIGCIDGSDLRNRLRDPLPNPLFNLRSIFENGNLSQYSLYTFFYIAFSILFGLLIKLLYVLDTFFNLGWVSVILFFLAGFLLLIISSFLLKIIFDYGTKIEIYSLDKQIFLGEEKLKFWQWFKITPRQEGGFSIPSYKQIITFNNFYKDDIGKALLEIDKSFFEKANSKYGNISAESILFEDEVKRLNKFGCIRIGVGGQRMWPRQSTKDILGIIFTILISYLVLIVGFYCLDFFSFGTANIDFKRIFFFNDFELFLVPSVFFPEFPLVFPTLCVIIICLFYLLPVFMIWSFYIFYGIFSQVYIFLDDPFRRYDINPPKNLFISKTGIKIDATELSFSDISYFEITYTSILLNTKTYFPELGSNHFEFKHDKWFFEHMTSSGLHKIKIGDQYIRIDSTERIDMVFTLFSKNINLE